MNTNTTLSRLECDISTIRKDPELLATRLRVPLVPIVASIAPELPADIREEVVQEVLIREFIGTRFDSTLGSLKAYLMLRAREAKRLVVAAYAPAGAKTRDAYRRPLSTDVRLTSGETIGELAQDSRTEFDTSLDRLEAEGYLALAQDSAPTQVATVLRLVHEGHTFESACAQVGENRSTLRRKVDKWAEAIQPGGHTAVLALAG